MSVGEPDREVGDDRSGRLSSGRPIAAIWAVEGLVAGGDVGALVAVAGRGQAEQDRRWPRSALHPARRPPSSSRARRSTRTNRASSASRQVTISRTWTGPAACRNVPQVVATGKTSVVTQNVSRDTIRSGRSARIPTGPGQPEQADQADREARHEQDAEQVVGEPVDPHLDQSAQARPPGSGPGWVGRSRQRCRSRSPTGHWPRPGRAAGCRRRASRGPSRAAKTRRAIDRRHRDRARTARPGRGGRRPIARGEPGQAGPGQRQPERPRCGSGRPARSGRPGRGVEDRRARAPRGSRQQSR